MAVLGPDVRAEPLLRPHLRETSPLLAFPGHAARYGSVSPETQAQVRHFCHVAADDLPLGGLPACVARLHTNGRTLASTVC